MIVLSINKEDVMCIINKINEIKTELESLKLSTEIAVKTREEMLKSCIKNIVDSVSKPNSIDCSVEIYEHAKISISIPYVSIRAYDNENNKYNGVDIQFDDDSNAYICVLSSDIYNEHNATIYALKLSIALAESLQKINEIVNSGTFKACQNDIAQYVEAKNKCSKEIASLLEVGLSFKDMDSSFVRHIVKLTNKCVHFDFGDYLTKHDYATRILDDVIVMVAG